MSSEPCPYHEHGQESQVDCECTIGNQTSLDKHAQFKGSYKTAYYGLIGTQKDVDIVHRKMQNMQNHKGIYTLIMNCGDNQHTIEKEINLFETIQKADPEGDFTPILVHYNRIHKKSSDDKALQKICANVRAYQDVKYKSVRVDKKNQMEADKNDGLTYLEYEFDNDEEKEEGQELVEMIESNEDSLYFMYVTDVGISLHDYVTDVYAIRDSNDIIQATRNLAENYQKLAKVGIGHYDMHNNNIMCKKRDGKLCLSIIDFGFGFAIEKGIKRNVLHFLFSGVSFDEAKKTRRSIRYCDPVHYNMFVMCFGMLRRILNQTNKPTLQIAKMIIHDMFISGFVEKDPVSWTPDTKNFHVLEEYIIESYKEFYTREQLQGIWKRVCEKTYVVVSDFLNRENGMQELSARTRITGKPNMYVPDNHYKYATKDKNAFSELFDAFSMAFYDRERQACDENFLRKKFDEYSIANVSMFILKKGMHTQKTRNDMIPFKTECIKLQRQFSAPVFFLQNDQCVHTPTFVDTPMTPECNSPMSPMYDRSNTSIDHRPTKRNFAFTPRPNTISQTSTPAAKRRDNASTTPVYNAARPIVNVQNVSPAPASLFSRFPVFRGSPMQQSIGSTSTPSPLQYSGRPLGMEDIVPVQTSDSMERDLPGVETNFGEGRAFTLLDSRLPQYFSPYAPFNHI